MEYTLTELGYSLKPVLNALEDWGEEYKAKSGAPAETGRKWEKGSGLA